METSFPRKSTKIQRKTTNNARARQPPREKKQDTAPPSPGPAKKKQDTAPGCRAPRKKQDTANPASPLAPLAVSCFLFRAKIKTS